MAKVEVDLLLVSKLQLRIANVQLTLFVIRGPLPAASATWAKCRKATVRILSKVMTSF
jgi:hypothetical protein